VPENYQEWNTLLCALLFPKKHSGVDLTARFDVEIYFGDGGVAPTLRVLGNDCGDAHAFVHAVETFVNEEGRQLQSNNGDLSQEFYEWKKQNPERDLGHWLSDFPHNEECPFIAVISYLVAIARLASESEIDEANSFYRALEAVRRKFEVEIRNPKQQTREIARARYLVEIFNTWIRDCRPSYRFNLESQYYRHMTNIGWLKEHALISNHEERVVLTVLYGSNQDPGVALSKQLQQILQQLIPTSEGRLVRIIRNHWKTCEQQMRGMIRDWDGTCPADDEDGSGDGADGDSVHSPRARLKLLLNVFEQRKEAYCTVVLDGDIGEDYENFQARWSDSTRPEGVLVECCCGAEVYESTSNQPIRVNPQMGGTLSFINQGQIKINPPVNAQITLFFRHSPGAVSKLEVSNGPFRNDEALWMLSTDTDLTAPYCVGIIQNICPEICGYKVLKVTRVDGVDSELRSKVGLVIESDSEIRFEGGIRMGRENRFFIDAPPTIKCSGAGLTFKSSRENGDSTWKLLDGAYHFVRAKGELRWEGTVCADGIKDCRIRLDSTDNAQAVTLFSRRLLNSGQTTCSGYLIGPTNLGADFVERAQVVSTAFAHDELTENDLLKMSKCFNDDLSRCPGTFLIELVKKLGTLSEEVFEKALRHCTARSGDHAHLEGFSWKDVSRRQRDCLVGLGHCEYNTERRCLVALKTTSSLLPRKCMTAPGQFAFVAVVHGWTRSDYRSLLKAVTGSQVQLLLHPQPKGAIALPPRLSVVAASVTEIKQVLEAVEIPLLESLSLDSRIDALFGADALSNAPDIGTWSDVDDLDRCTSADPDSVEVFCPQICWWVSQIKPWVDPQLAGTWAIRTKRLNWGRYDYYLLVRPTATSGRAVQLKRAKVTSDPWPAAAWYAWVAWQRSRAESVLISQQGQADRLAIPFVARPPWWLDRALCSCSGLAPEWQNFSNRFSADDLKKIGGYPVPDQHVDPESLSPHAQKIRLLTYNSILPETIAKRLLWPFTEHKKLNIAFVD
jgi:hypothetical protein